MIDGIQPPFEAFYIESMLWHSKSAKRSINALDDWLYLIEEDDERAANSSSIFFDELQNILHKAGCISRYFFPSGRALKQPHIGRAMRLRRAFAVDENNPLAKRDLRNAIEHFDERLDRYLTSNHVGEFIPEEIRYLPLDSELPRHIFKGFYVGLWIFKLLGQPYEMAPVIKEILRIHDILIASEAAGHRLPT